MTESISQDITESVTRNAIESVRLGELGLAQSNLPYGTSENSSPRRRTFSDGSVVDVSSRRYTNGGPLN